MFTSVDYCLHLLRTRRTVIEKWFHQVQRHYDAFSVPVNSALPLIQAFPVDDDHPGDDILDVSLLAPFQEQLDRFLRTHISEFAFRSVPTTDVANRLACNIKCICNAHLIVTQRIKVLRFPRNDKPSLRSCFPQRLWAYGTGQYTS